MSMIYNLIVIPTEQLLPAPDTIVIVEGGIARWNGKHWISECLSGGGNVIQWEVKWWAMIPMDPLFYDKR